jgi:hypothetical protein
MSSLKAGRRCQIEVAPGPAADPGANATGRTSGRQDTLGLVDQTAKNVFDVSATLVETLFVVSVSRMFV